MAQFYANENFPRPVVDELRRLGHDVLTIQETGKGGEAVMARLVGMIHHNRSERITDDSTEDC